MSRLRHPDVAEHPTHVNNRWTLSDNKHHPVRSNQFPFLRPKNLRQFKVCAVIAVNSPWKMTRHASAVTDRPANRVAAKVTGYRWPAVPLPQHVHPPSSRNRVNTRPPRMTRGKAYLFSATREIFQCSGNDLHQWRGRLPARQPVPGTLMMTVCHTTMTGFHEIQHRVYLACRTVSPGCARSTDVFQCLPGARGGLHCPCGR